MDIVALAAVSFAIRLVEGRVEVHGRSPLKWVDSIDLQHRNGTHAKPRIAPSGGVVTLVLLMYLKAFQKVFESIPSGGSR